MHGGITTTNRGLKRDRISLIFSDGAEGMISRSSSSRNGVYAFSVLLRLELSHIITFWVPRLSISAVRSSRKGEISCAMTCL